MSEETKGWTRFRDEYEKKIEGKTWTIFSGSDGYALYLYGSYCTFRSTLRECQHLAHATARLWAGDTP